MPVMKIKVDGKWVEVGAGGSGGSDYQTAVEMADESIRTKADAIICSANGEPIVVHDSAEDPLRGLKIFGKTTQAKTTGKNLLEVTAITKTVSGVTFTVNADGSVTANGTSTDQIWFHLTEKINLPVGNYIFSGAKPFSDGCYLVDYTYDSNGTYIRAFVDSGNSVVVEVTDNTVGHGFQFYVPSGLTLNGLTVYPMLRYATITDSTYEPYTGGVAAPNPNYPQELESVGDDGNVVLTVSGKNILHSSSWDQSNHPASGVTFTMNTDGTVTANGTASLNTAYFTNFEFKAGITYTLSGCPSGAELIAYVEGAWTGQKTDTGHGVTWTQKADVVGMIALRITQGTVANNMVFKPQLEIGSVATAFEPYTDQIMSISTPNALPGIPVPTDISEVQKVNYGDPNYIDPNGRQWICDEIDFERGVYVQRVGSTSGLTFILADGTGYPVGNSLLYSAILPGNLSPNINRHRYALCDKLPYTLNILKNDISGFYVLNSRIYARIAGVADVDTFNTLMANAKFQIALEPAVETPLASDQLAAFKALRTKRPNTTVMNDVGAQMEMSYNADTEIWLENELNKRISHDGPAITNTATGEHIVVRDSAEDSLKGLKIFGKTIQNVTPSITTPAALVSVGNSGRITVEISDPEAGANAQTMSVSTPNGLPGIKVHAMASVRGNYIDANGDEWLCDEIDFARGKYIKRVGIQVFDGSTDEAWGIWAISGGVKYRVQTALVASTICKNADNYTYPNIASNMFVATCAGSPGIWAGTTGITVDVDGNIFCYTDLYNTSDVSLWTAFLAEHPMTVHYQLAAPVETDLTADELAAFKALRTKRPNTAVTNDAGAQMEISYNADIEIWLENELNKRLSHDDSAAPAITNTAIGEHIMVCDSVEDNLKGLKIFGKTTQNGAPNPSVPIALENVGDGGSIAVKIGISESDTNPQTFAASTPNGLPGIPTSSGGNYTDSNGQQWICDEIDFARGKYVHRILKVVFDGSADETWAMTATNTSGTYRIGNNTYTGMIEGAASVSNLSMGMCTHYPMVAAGTTGTWGCNTGLSVGTAGQIYIFDPAYSGSTSTEWKAYLAANPITCIFKLVTPTEANLAEADLNNFAKLHTNCPTTTVYANGVVVSMDYVADTKTYIDKTFNYQSYGLPVLSLTGDTTGMTKENAVTMNYRYNGRSGTCTVKWQGTSSLAYDKKNFTIKFDNAFEAKTGWGAQKKYCLKANFIDPSHARNIVSARLWAKVVGNRGDGLFNTTPNRGAIDGFPIVLSINGEFWGLYTFNIPKDGWMFGLPESSTLTQAVVCAEGTALDNACSFSKPAKVDGTDFSLEYVSDENNSAWVQTSLNRLINACINSDGTDLDTTIAQYLDWQSAIDFHIFTCLIGAYDLQVKNYLLVTLDGTKWYFSVYDMDSTFGLEWTGKGFRAPNGCAPLPAPNGTYHKVMKMIATYKKDELKARYEQIKQILNTSVIHTDFYDFASEIPQTVLNEDWKKWPSIPGTSANNAAQIVDWYRNRFEYIKTKIDVL